MQASQDKKNETVIDKKMSKRLRSHLLFVHQSKRFMCFFTYLIILTTIVLVTMFILVTNTVIESTLVGCTAEGRHWQFSSCGISFAISFTHVFTSMQGASMARGVFIKSLKKVLLSAQFKKTGWNVVERPKNTNAQQKEL